jgi:hypothetical protein
MTKLIYNYHPLSGVFLCATIADESPLEPGVFVVPAFATEIATPAVDEGQVAVFQDGVWLVKRDTRGEWFDANHERVLIDTIAANVDALTRDAPPSPAHDLEQGVWILNQARATSLAMSEFTSAIQKRLDDFARTRNYDSILSACTYATSAVSKFKAEGQACVNLRDVTWAAAYDILGKVQAGKRTMPATLADIEADLPTLEWPQ